MEQCLFSGSYIELISLFSMSYIELVSFHFKESNSSAIEIAKVCID